jgi:5-methylcytosine-specific restriction endonuclease McrA
MTLPPRIPKKAKRDSRWRSPAHCRFVTSHACCACGSTTAIEAAHVRIGTHTGMGQKPDDWRVVSLCNECHTRQHNIGEVSFWRGIDREALVAAFITASPKRREIFDAMREKGV